jgi:uncharacterized protein Usg
LDHQGLGIRMISPDFQKQATGYGLTTAQILYRRPDHPWLLQTYVWRAYDLCPEFPELQGFLEFWQKSLEGVLAFGHGRTFSPYQTGRDQTGGRAVPAALISDRLHSPLRRPRTAAFPWRIHHRGNPVCATKRRKGKADTWIKRRPSTSHVFSRRVRLFLSVAKSFCGDGNRKRGSVLRGRLFPQVIHKTITVSTRCRESWQRNWVGDADERHFLSAFSKKPGRQPGLRRTLKFGAGQFRRTG